MGTFTLLVLHISYSNKQIIGPKQQKFKKVFVMDMKQEKQQKQQVHHLNVGYLHSPWICLWLYMN